MVAAALWGAMIFATLGGIVELSTPRPAFSNESSTGVPEFPKAVDGAPSSTVVVWNLFEPPIYKMAVPMVSRQLVHAHYNSGAHLVTT